MQKIIVNKYLFVFSLISTAALLFNMSVLPLFGSEVVDKSAPTTIIQLILLGSFITVFAFNASCFFWGCRKPKVNRDSVLCTFVMLVSVFCIIMIFGQRTMLDELSRQYHIQQNSGKEWIILYLFFIIQLAFNMRVIVKLKQRMHSI